MNSSVPDTVGSPTGSADPGFPARTFTVLASGTAGDTEHRSEQPAQLCQRRTAADRPRRPGSALPPSGSAGLPGRGASGPRGSRCSAGPGLGGKDPEGSAGRPFPLPRPSVWLAGTHRPRLGSDDPTGMGSVWRGLCDPRTHRDIKLSAPTPTPATSSLANLTSRIRGRSRKVLSEHPLLGACDLQGFLPPRNPVPGRCCPGAELSETATD